jgi:SAM-dependent methyltransferase
MPDEPSPASPSTDPTPVYRLRDGLYAGDLLAAAVVGLGFFTWLAENPSDEAGVCRALSLHPRPADVLLTLCVARGLLRREQRVYHVTPLAREHLVAGSPWNLTPYFESLRDRPAIAEFLDVLRTGKPAAWASHQKPWAAAMEDEAFAERFTAAMDCRGAFLGAAVARALDLRKHARLLDVAGGSGVYACTVVSVHTHLQATVFEKPPVDVVASRAVKKRGLADRVAVVAGDMWNDPYPSGCDVHLLSHVLHDWDEPEVERLVRKSANALPPGGLLVVYDAHLDEAKAGPLPVAEYSALLVHSTQGRCYSVKELQDLMRWAGLVATHVIATVADRSLVVGTKPWRSTLAGGRAARSRLTRA